MSSLLVAIVFFSHKMANEGYSNAEMTDMLLVYVFCQGNDRESVKVYRDRFPDAFQIIKRLHVSKDVYVKEGLLFLLRLIMDMFAI